MGGSAALFSGTAGVGEEMDASAPAVTAARREMCRDGGKRRHDIVASQEPCWLMRHLIF